jgi:hypothetical protein
MDEIPYSLEEHEEEQVPRGPAPSLETPVLAVHGLSARAALQRKALAWALEGLTLASLLLTLGVQVPLEGWSWMRWIVAAALGVALARIPLAARASLAKAREVRLHEQAIEIRRGGFRRLVVYESLRHLVLRQSPQGRLISLRLDLEDDSVTLRDLQGLERIFAAAAQNRPPKVLIEIEERRVDWREPLPWFLAAALASAAAAAALLLWPA